MTELEKLQRAKMYIDKLANGINPIDDTTAKEDDIINNVRVTRCLFYVSDVLRQVIENSENDSDVKKTDDKSADVKAEIFNEESVEKKKRKSRRSFYISQEKLNQFVPSEVPVTISVFVQMINDLAGPEHGKNLRTTVITDWLVNLGALEERTDKFGVRTKYATTNGINRGITNNIRIGKLGDEYNAVVYNKYAQQFIVDNLYEILACLWKED